MPRGQEPSKLVRLLGHVSIAITLSSLMLAAVGIFAMWFSSLLLVWAALFSIVVSYVGSDFMLNLIVKGSNGILQFPLFGTHARSRGHGYLVFLGGIVFVTFVTSKIADFVAGNYGYFLRTSTTIWPLMVFLTSAFVCILCFLDMEVRFYEKKK